MTWNIESHSLKFFTCWQYKCEDCGPSNCAREICTISQGRKSLISYIHLTIFFLPSHQISNYPLYILFPIDQWWFTFLFYVNHTERKLMPQKIPFRLILHFNWYFALLESSHRWNHPLVTEYFMLSPKR